MVAGPLEGVKIIDFTQMMAGPWGTQMLADLGAEVIKIERPGTGEWERGLESMGELLAGDSPFFHAMNRNKKSLTLDLKHPEAKKIVYRLVEGAGVVVENFRPGVLDRLGYGYDKLSEINPGIVYLSSSGYGSSGPYVGWPGQDLLIQGMSGMLAHTGKGEDLPTPAGSSVVDEGTAMVNAMSVLAALYRKERTGRGQKVEVNLLSTAVAMQCQEAVAHLNLGQRFERSKAGIGSPWLSAPFGVYPTKDGHMTISMSDLPTIGRIFELPELEKYEDPMDAFHRRDEIKRLIEAKTPAKTTAWWLEILNENKVWCGPVNTFEEVFTDPQVEHNGLVVTMEHPKAGELKLIGFPATFSETPATYRSAAPLVGEHNEEVLRSLGYDEAGIRRLEEEGVTGRARGRRRRVASEARETTVEEQVLYEEDGAIALITFNREEKLNAMNSAIVRRLTELFERVDRSDRVRAAVLAGRGRAFVAGADIGEYAGQSFAEFSEYQAVGRRMYEGIEKNRKPFVAAVNGYALGGGFEMVLCCDLVVASREATLGLPEIHLGLLPGGGGTQKLARLVGRNLAKEFLMTGRSMTAEEGHRLGVVNRVVEPGALMDEALDLARKVARRAPYAVREAKRLVNQGVESPVEVALSYEQAALSNLYQTADAKEGIRAFVEKRKPEFRGE